MTQPIFLTDVDSVLSDFFGFTLGVLKDVFGKVYTPGDFSSWQFMDELPDDEKAHLYRDLNSRNIQHEFRPIAGAQIAISSLRHRGFRVVAVTTRFKTSKTWAYDRDSWLKELYGFNTEDDVVYTGAKELVRGDVFVDDKPEHIVNWKRLNPTGLAILFSYPNTDVSCIPADLGHEVAHNWYDVMSHVNKHIPA